MRKNTVMELKVVEENEPTSEAEQDMDEEMDTLDDSAINELIEYMEGDDSSDIVSQHIEEDDDSEVVQRLYANPKHIVPKAKNPKYTSTRVVAMEETEEDSGPKGRWLITGCRSCGDIVRFRSDQPKPPTCERIQCIEKYEERIKASMFNKAS